AVFIVLAYRFPGIFGRVDDALPGIGIAGQVMPVTVGGIGVAAGRAYRGAGSENVRTGHDTRVDGVAQRDGVVIVVADIAYAGEAGLERALGVDDAADRVVGGVPAEVVAVAGWARLFGQMHMAVDQAGQAGDV